MWGGGGTPDTSAPRVPPAAPSHAPRPLSPGGRQVPLAGAFVPGTQPHGAWPHFPLAAAGAPPRLPPSRYLPRAGPRSAARCAQAPERLWGDRQAVPRFGRHEEAATGGGARPYFSGTDAAGRDCRPGSLRKCRTCLPERPYQARCHGDGWVTLACPHRSAVQVRPAAEGSESSALSARGASSEPGAALSPGVVSGAGCGCHTARAPGVERVGPGRRPGPRGAQGRPRACHDVTAGAPGSPGPSWSASNQLLS